MQFGWTATVRSGTVEHGGSSVQVADHQLVHGLERGHIVDRVEHGVDRIELADQGALLSGREAEIGDRVGQTTVAVELDQLDPVDRQVDVARSEGVGGDDRLSDGSYGHVEPGVVEPSLERGAEQIAEVLALADPGEEPVGLADAGTGEVDRGGRAGIVGAACEPAGPQDRRGGGVGQRRSVDEALRRAIVRAAQVERHAVVPDVEPVGPQRAQRGQSLRGQARVPCVEPVVAESERLAYQPVQFVGGHAGQTVQGLTQLGAIGTGEQRRIEQLIEERRFVPELGGQRHPDRDLGADRTAVRTPCAHERTGAGQPAAVGPGRVSDQTAAERPEVLLHRHVADRLVLHDQRAAHDPLHTGELGQEQLQIVAPEHAVESGDVEPPQRTLPKLVADQLLDDVLSELAQQGEDLTVFGVDRPPVVDGRKGLRPHLDLLLDPPDVLLGRAPLHRNVDGPDSARRPSPAARAGRDAVDVGPARNDLLHHCLVELGQRLRVVRSELVERLQVLPSEATGRQHGERIRPLVRAERLLRRCADRGRRARRAGGGELRQWLIAPIGGRACRDPARMRVVRQHAGDQIAGDRVRLGGRPGECVGGVVIENGQPGNGVAPLLAEHGHRVGDPAGDRIGRGFGAGRHHGQDPVRLVADADRGHRRPTRHALDEPVTQRADRGRCDPVAELVVVDAMRREEIAKVRAEHALEQRDAHVA